MRAASIGRKIKDTFLAAPLFVKFMGVALGMSVFLDLGLLWQIRETWYQDELQESAEYGRFFARDLAAHIAPLLREGDKDGIQQLVHDFGEISPEVNAVRVQDDGGRLLASAGPVDPKARVREVMVPIGDGSAGSLWVAMNEAHAMAEVAWLTRLLLGSTAVIMVVGMGAAWWLARLFTRPVQELVTSTRRVKKGDYQTRAPVHARDELGELAEAFNEMTAALQQDRAVRRQLMRKVIAAAEEERKRVARELHDQAGQSLTALIAGLTSLQTDANREQLAELRALATGTLREVHDLSLALRPSELEDFGLVTTLRKLCKNTAARFGVKVTCTAIGLNETTRLPDEFEVAIYRIGQEAITNAVRHGKARSIEVMLQRKETSLLAVIEDDGRGFDTNEWRARCLREDHLGLLGIEERASLLGGTLRVESRPGTGTGLFVEIPIQKNHHA